MKHIDKIKKYALSALMALSVFTLSSVISLAGVQNTKHDLSYNSSNPPNIGQFLTDQICVFCHTPHKGNTGVRANTSVIANGAGNGTWLNTSGAGAGAPVYLWNRVLNTTSATYTLYTSSTMNAYSGEVRLYSLMCLSCHDGVGALNVMLNPPSQDGNDPGEWLDANGMPLPMTDDGTHDQLGDAGPNSPVNISERYTSGDDQINKLSNDHPISIDYTATHPDVIKGGLKDPNTGLGGLRLFRNPSGLYTSLECSTCHDVHNMGVDDGSPTSTYPFLAKANGNSALCLNCHLK